MISAELDNLLLDNVVTLQFVKKTTGEIRKMTCTKAYNLLNSPEGYNILKYRQPKGSPTYDIAKANNVVVWDLDNDDFRTVSCDTVKILDVVPQEKFLAILRLKND